LKTPGLTIQSLSEHHLEPTRPGVRDHQYPIVRDAGGTAAFVTAVVYGIGLLLAL